VSLIFEEAGNHASAAGDDFRFCLGPVNCYFGSTISLGFLTNFICSVKDSTYKYINNNHKHKQVCVAVLVLFSLLLETTVQTLGMLFFFLIFLVNHCSMCDIVN